MSRGKSDHLMNPNYRGKGWDVSHGMRDAKHRSTSHSKEDNIMGVPIIPDLMEEAIQEVITHRVEQEAKERKDARRAARAQHNNNDDMTATSSEEEALASSMQQAQQALRPASSASNGGVRIVAASSLAYQGQPERRWGWVGALKGGRPSPVPSSSERKALGDDWYIDRCVTCAKCTQPVRSTCRELRGVRCAGCGAWFHDGCAPAGTLPQSRAAREEDPMTSSFYHCGQCRQVQSSLAAAAAQLRRKQACAALSPTSTPPSSPESLGPSSSTTAAAQPSVSHANKGANPFFSLIGGWFGHGAGAEQGQGLTPEHSLVLVDLARVRRALKAGPTTDTSNKGAQQREVADQAKLPNGQHGGGEAFQRVAHYQLRRMGSLGDVYGARRAGGGSDAGASSQGVIPGLADVRRVASVLRHYDPEEQTEDVLENGWAALLTHQGRPVCGATFDVCGVDHARLQALATVPGAVCQGHATALSQALQDILAKAGVPRLVAVLPAQPPLPSAHRLLTHKLGMKPLDDISLLASWKAVWRSYYATELIGMDAHIYTKTLPAQTPQAVQDEPESQGCNDSLEHNSK